MKGKGTRSYEEERRSAEMTPTADDLAYGQIAIVTFRWILVLAGLLFSIWNPDSVSRLRLQILVILALAVVNFYLHAQLLMRKPSVQQVAYAASAGDIAVITLITLAQGGFPGPAFVFYYPAILVFSVAFPTSATFSFTGAIIALYGLISAGTGGLDGANQQVLITRLLTLAGVGVCGNIYWRVERDRRSSAQEAREKLMAQVREREAGVKP